MPSFDGRTWVILQPNDVDVPYRFRFPIASGVSSADGVLPYGDTLSSVSVVAYNAANTVVTTQMVGAVATGNDYATVALSYPTSSGNGSYKLTFVVTTAAGVVQEFDFKRVAARTR